MYGIVAPRPALWGMLAFAVLVALYFGVLTLVSGWEPALSEFSRFGYYVVALAAGFGIQVALFARLRDLVSRAKGTTGVVAASGTTSTAAMISCCAHYLANAAPILGATGVVALAAQFQVQFFWAGLVFNAAGMAYLGSKLVKAQRAHAQCVA